MENVELTQENYDFLSQFRNKPLHDENGASSKVSYLMEMNCLTPTKQDCVSSNGMVHIYDVEWSITEVGLTALSTFEDKANQQSKNERQRRFQNKISIAQTLVPLITFILGILVEHFAGIIGLILSLFQ